MDGNGCCSTDGVHRATVLPINGALHAAQRFAIDWIRLDDQGRLVNGDPSDLVPTSLPLPAAPS